MPWAINGTVSHDHIEAGIEITEDQYLAAIQAILAGKLIRIDSGALTFEDQPIPPEPERPPLPDFFPIPRYDFWIAVHDAFGLTKDEVLAAIDTSDLDANQQYLAKLGIADAQTYRRDDPNVVTLLTLMGYSAQEADTFWKWASQSGL